MILFNNFCIDTNKSTFSKRINVWKTYSILKIYKILECMKGFINAKEMLSTKSLILV